MTTSEQLCQIMAAQADLMDAITEVLGQTQTALLNSDGAALELCTAREEELLHPFHDLEVERIRCVQEMKPGTGSIPEILEDLPDGHRETVRELASRMKDSAQKIVELNSMNTILLTNAHRFVQETLRVITNDHRRKLVDERI